MKEKKQMTNKRRTEITIETHEITVIKTNGKSFDETERYTTTWVWRMGRWQIVGDHTSMIQRK